MLELYTILSMIQLAVAYYGYRAAFLTLNGPTFSDVVFRLQAAEDSQPSEKEVDSSDVQEK